MNVKATPLMTANILMDMPAEFVQARLDALLQEGLDSGPSTPMTAQDWTEIRLEVQHLDAINTKQAPDGKLPDDKPNATP